MVVVRTQYILEKDQIRKVFSIIESSTSFDFFPLFCKLPKLMLHLIHTRLDPYPFFPQHFSHSLSHQI